MDVGQNFFKRALSILIVFILILSMMPQPSFAKTAYDPKEDYKQLELRFWEDRQPDIGFYINASSRYILETVTKPQMGSTFGEWSVMDLLRGMYTGYDYMNYIPENYFEDYLARIEGYVVGKEGNLDRNKSTEWSRLILTLSSLGYDIKKVGTPGNFVKTYATYNTGVVNALRIEEDNLLKVEEPVKIYDNNRKYIEIPSGAYTADASVNTLTDESGTAYQLNAGEFVNLEKGYDFIEKLSASYRFSYRQGINGPIWEIIAMNTGGYELYEDGANTDVNTFGKMIDYILNKEIVQTDGTVGGWALSGKKPDPDITGMAIQALAPYYLDRTKYEKAGASASYGEFAQAVERAVYVLSLIQQENGGYSSWGTINSESVVQVIVALTALNIDPLQEKIELKHIGKMIDFLTDGKEYEGVFSNNMIDALLSFWANGSGSSPEIGGFKHVTAGYDGGGGSGTGVNAMATDQALYGLIAYDRHLKRKSNLYDMTDMINGEYKNTAPKTYIADYEGNLGKAAKTEFHSPYASVTIPEGESANGKTFVSWNTKADGSGAEYKPGEILSMPEQDITLYAQYEWTAYTIDFETNGATFIGDDLPSTYTSSAADILLPTVEQLRYEGYNFQGWYDNAVFTGEPVTAIATGSHGNKRYYARWLSDAEAAAEVQALITALPEVDKLAVNQADAIFQARIAYDKLNEVQRKLVNNHQKLVDLEARLAELTNGEADRIAAKGVIEEIGKLPSLENLTVEHESLVQKAREAYKGLTASQQKLVTNYKVLEAVEEKLAELAMNETDKEAAEKVTKKINSLPEMKDLTLEHQVAVEEARQTFKNLTAAQQKLVKNQVKLTALEAKLKELAGGGADKKAAESVEAMIGNLPETKDLTLEHQAAVEEARQAFKNLTAAQQKLVKNQAKLTVLEAKLKELAGGEADKKAAESVEAMIGNLPDAPFLTLEHKSAVEKARQAYKSLTAAQQKLVENQAKLTASEAKIAGLTKAEADKTAAEQVIAQIDALPRKADVALRHEAAIERAREAYENLTVAQQKLVPNYNELIQLEERLEELKESTKEEADLAAAQKVIEEISNLPSVADLKSENKPAVEKARQAYKELTVTQRKLVTNYDELLALEARLAELEDEATDQSKDGDKDSNNAPDATPYNGGDTGTAPSGNGTLASKNPVGSTPAASNGGGQSNQISKAVTGAALPNTATNNFNLLLIGFTFVIIGGLIYFYRRNKPIN